MQHDPRFPRLHIVDHPLIQHKLSIMRDKNTLHKGFPCLTSRNRFTNGLRSHEEFAAYYPQH